MHQRVYANVHTQDDIMYQLVTFHEGRLQAPDR